MKRMMLVLVLLLFTFCTFADQLMFVQGMGLSTNRAMGDGTNKVDQSIGMIGVNITTFMGKSLGFFSSSSFLLPNSVSSTVNGVSIPSSLDMYDDLKMGLDMIAGLGYLMPLSGNVSLIIGGGLHFNGLVLIPSNYMYSSYLSYTMGPGAQATGYVEIAPGIYFSFSGLLGYDVSEVMRTPDLPDGIEYIPSMTFAFAGGIGFTY